jgi:hypothetical protein
MRLNSILLTFLFLMALTHQSNGQDKMLLLNGKEVLTKPESINIDSLRIRFVDFKTGKKKCIKKENVFSILNEKGGEKVVYKEDSTSLISDLSLEEMRMYIKGEQDSRKYFKAPAATVGGFFIGGGSSFLVFYALIPPATYIAIIGNHSPDMSKQQVSDPELLKNNMYVNGYQKQARSRKIANAELGGLAGFMVGLVVYFIVHK